MDVIPPTVRPWQDDWLDSSCWGCGTDGSTVGTDGLSLCRPCRRELLAEPVLDALGLARHAYWESHALRCCWRCMTGAVDPTDDVGLCSGCRQEIAPAMEEGAA
jgi:hypothetical protein